MHIWGPPSTTLALRRRLTRYLSPPLFPVRLRDLPCRLVLHDVPLERFEIGPFQVDAGAGLSSGSDRRLPDHDGRRHVAYLPDHEPALGARRRSRPPRVDVGFGLAAGADLLVHDAQYSAPSTSSTSAGGTAP